MANVAEAAPGAAPVEAQPRGSVARRRAWVAVRVIFFLAFAVFGIELAAANSAELSGATSYLSNVKIAWVVIAVGVEGLAYVASAFLQRRLLRSGGVNVGLVPLAGIALAGNALSTSVPGGGAMASVFAYRQFRRRGADEAQTTWTLVAFTALTALTLAFLSAVGLGIAGANSDVGGLIPLIAILTVGPVAGIVVLLRPHLIEVVLARPLGWTSRRLGIPRRSPDQLLPTLVGRLQAVQPRRTDWLVAAGFSLLNWVADCLCLVAAATAVGTMVPWRGLLLAYGAAQVASNLPITPGGLGIVEGSLTVGLVAYGGSTEAMVAAVVLYRIISFWAALPVGWGVWLLLHLQGRRHEVRL